MSDACWGPCSEVKEREIVRSRSRLASPPRRSPPRRPSPARRKEPEYSVRLSSRPVVTLERDYQEVIHRHARLYVSADFSKVVSTWAKVRTAAIWCTLVLTVQLFLSNDLQLL